jgi:hypothetical protein
LASAGKDKEKQAHCQGNCGGGNKHGLWKKPLSVQRFTGYSKNSIKEK